MNFLTQKYLWLLCGGLTAFMVAVILIPLIIELAKVKNLVDVPDHRKEHTNPIPTLGGIAIFLGIFSAILIWLDISLFLEMKYILFAISLLFVVGIWDDLKDLSPLKKLTVQLIAAFVVAGSGVRVESLQGLFGVYELHLAVQYGFTVLLLVGITNAVNLMDGIDGLAAGVVTINALVFTVLFAFKGELIFALLSMSLAGALLGFLYYNFNPAKIFMGDTGSLVIGFLLGVLGIKYLQTDNVLDGTTLVVVVGILILPVFDTLRVFTLRLVKRKSPFSPDRNHIHHLLIKAGYNHKYSALIIYFVNATIIMTAFVLCNSELGLFPSLLLLIVLIVFISELLSIQRIKKINLKVKDLYHERKNRENENYLLTNLNQEDGRIKL